MALSRSVTSAVVTVMAWGNPLVSTITWRLIPVFWAGLFFCPFQILSDQVIFFPADVTWVLMYFSHLPFGFPLLSFSCPLQRLTKREQYQQKHRDELALFDAAAVFLKSLKESGEAITPKAWRAEAATLTQQKDMDYAKMRAMRDEIKAVESLRKAADRLAREGQHQQKENER